MSLDLRLMHVTPAGVNRTWDIKLMDERQNARVHLNMAGTEFIDLVILGGEHFHPENIKPKRDHQLLRAKRNRRKALKKKRSKKKD